jgi:uncharacterized protein (TIGR02391 family)
MLHAPLPAQGAIVTSVRSAAVAAGDEQPMTMVIRDLLQAVPTADALLALTPKELELILLRFVGAATADPLRRMVTCEGTLVELFAPGGGYDMAKRDPVSRAVRRAFKALEAAELIEAPDPYNGQNGYRVISDNGRQVDTTVDLDAAKVRDWLKPELLHKTMPVAVMNSFASADYDTAVFEAFKAVESAVRKKGGFTQSDFGVELMRKAFHPDQGPLRDQGATRSRRERRQELFMGALGELRNPKGHNDPTITDPRLAIEEIMTASVLLRIVNGI